MLEFLKVMAERSRIRRRDGARRWSLLRDLSDPQIWIERYHNPPGSITSARTSVSRTTTRKSGNAYGRSTAAPTDRRSAA